MFGGAPVRGDFVPHNGLDRGARRAVVRAVLVRSRPLSSSRSPAAAAGGYYKEHESSRGHCSKLTHSGRTPPFSIRFFRIAECRKQPYILSPFLSNGLYLPLHTAWGISSRPIVPTPHFLHAAACAIDCRPDLSAALLPYKLPPYRSPPPPVGKPQIKPQGTSAVAELP